MGHTISHNLEIILKWTLWSVCAPSAFAHPRRRRRHVHNGATGRATSTAYRPLGPGSPAVASDPPDASISRRRDRPHKRERVHRDAASRWRGACCRARRVRSAHASNATVVVAASAGHHWIFRSDFTKNCICHVQFFSRRRCALLRRSRDSTATRGRLPELTCHPRRCSAGAAPRSVT